MDDSAQWTPQALRLQAGHTAYLPLAPHDWLVVSHGSVHLHAGLCLNGASNLLPDAATTRLDSGAAWQPPARGWVQLSSPGGAELVCWTKPAGQAGLRGLLRQARRLFPVGRRDLVANGPAV